jgi:hypothetical protein
MNKSILVGVIAVISYLCFWSYNQVLGSPLNSPLGQMNEALESLESPASKEIGKNMTYDRVIELQEENPKTCLNWREIENITLRAECEFIMGGGGYPIIEEHEAQLEQAVEDKKLAFFDEMGVHEKINGILDKCKNQSIANSSVLELVECIDFIETYAEGTIK